MEVIVALLLIISIGYALVHPFKALGTILGCFGYLLLWALAIAVFTYLLSR